MSNLPKIRKDIESLHEDLLKFILNRAKLVDQIWHEKQILRMDLVDVERENLLVHQFDHYSDLKNNENLKQFYQNVVKSIIAENKAYMKKSFKK